MARVQAKPDPWTWALDELMTLREAAALFWPSGLLTEKTLRTAIRNGNLDHIEIARKFYVTRRIVEAMCKAKDR
ncbi:hypothetical protein [Beijerinckia sp. L45]|uniref:hypothetical protein n=1 Tax=Beijerinckia sp. L45 TaxID=1641855 RepID=UPI00131D86CF|nr:hypothetical protein [Beijerinckia sp. L45]